MNKKIKFLHYLVVIFSIFFTVCIMFRFKFGGPDIVALYTKFKIPYLTILCPPIVLNLILRNKKNLRQEEIFGLKLQRKVAAVTLSIHFAPIVAITICDIFLPILSNDFEVFNNVDIYRIFNFIVEESYILVPWLLILVYSVYRLHRILSYRKRNYNKKNDE